MVHEGRVLFRVQHLEKRRRRVAAEVHAHLVDLVEQEERVGLLRLLHRLDDLAGHRADIGAAVAADLGLVPHAAERHADIFAARRPGDGFRKRGLADARRADEAKDRALDLVGPGLHGEVLDDALLDLVEAEMILVEDLFGVVEVGLDLRLLAPRNARQPVEIVAHDGGLGRHRAHLAQLLELGVRLLAGLLRELGLGDLLFQFGHLVAAVLAVAELLLDRLHLLVEVVLALGLLHLAFYTRADALFDLQDGDLAFHEAERLFKAQLHARRLQHFLLFDDLDGEVRSDRVGELRVVLDLARGTDDLGRDLLVELHIVLELGDDRARQRLDLHRVLFRLGQHMGRRLVEFLAVGIAVDLGARAAFDQHLDGAVGQLEELENVGDGADAVDGVGLRVVVGGVDLGGKHDLPVGASSSARIDFSRPTNSGTIICGNTTMSRRGRTGKAVDSCGADVFFVMSFPFKRPVSGNRTDRCLGSPGRRSFPPTSGVRLTLFQVRPRSAPPRGGPDMRSHGESLACGPVAELAAFFRQDRRSIRETESKSSILTWRASFRNGAPKQRKVAHHAPSPGERPVTKCR